MQIRNALLLLWPLPKLSRPTPPEERPDGTAASPDTYLNKYFDDGNWAGIYAYHSTPVRARWGEARLAFALSPGQLAHAGFALLGFENVDAAQLFTQAGKQRLESRATLIRDLYGKSGNDFPDRNCLSILFVEPAETLVNPDADTGQYVAALRGLRRLLGQDDSAAIPQRFEDLLVFHGKSSLAEEYDLIAIRIGPMQYNKDSRHHIAESVLSLAAIVGLSHRLIARGEEIAQEPLLQHSASSYAREVLELGLPTGGWALLKRSRHTKVARAYERHMKERLDGIGAHDSARELAVRYRTAKAELDRNATLVDDDWLWKSTIIMDNPYRRGVVRSLRLQLDGPGRAIENAVEELTLREQAVSEFFRDYLNAAVAQSNLSLQRIVLWLTVVAIAVALLPLLR